LHHDIRLIFYNEDLSSKDYIFTFLWGYLSSNILCRRIKTLVMFYILLLLLLLLLLLIIHYLR